MKKLFYIGVLGLLVFEILNIYFIMPLPGSQKMNSVDLAFFLYSWRWIFRGIFVGIIVVGLVKAKWKKWWSPVISILIAGALLYFINFRMSADHMFLQPQNIVFVRNAGNKVDTNRLVLGVVLNGEAKAYPIRFLGYHHIVPDTLGGKPILLTYCTVCRTGRAFDPVVNGKPEQFRLVGMDHFNAMLEDATTKSWWRQATGTAITGELKGHHLEEIYCNQLSLGEWLRLYPQTLIMQEEAVSNQFYPKNFDYENGSSKSILTGSDNQSWKDKSWVVGILSSNSAKAYDWNLLRSKRIVEDSFAGMHLIIVLAEDAKSFFAYKVPAGFTPVEIKGNKIICNNYTFGLNGVCNDTAFALEKVAAYQEFWHSWRTFHPATEMYGH